MPDWANPAVVRRNVEPTHASFTAYATEDAARTARPIAPFYLTDQSHHRAVVPEPQRTMEVPLVTEAGRPPR